MAGPRRPPASIGRMAASSTSAAGSTSRIAAIIGFGGSPCSTSEVFMNRHIVFVAALLLGSSALVAAKDDYQLGPDSMEQPGVPKGKVEHFTWKSDIFPGTI